MRRATRPMRHPRVHSGSVSGSWAGSPRSTSWGPSRCSTATTSPRSALQLRCLADDGADRLVLNFAGVRSISSDVLGILAALARRFDPSRGRIRVRGLDPVLLNMLRICRLDRVLEVEGCEPWTS